MRPSPTVAGLVRTMWRGRAILTWEAMTGRFEDSVDEFSTEGEKMVVFLTSKKRSRELQRDQGINETLVIANCR
jgi:hypothetical protein